MPEQTHTDPETVAGEVLDDLAEMFPGTDEFRTVLTTVRQRIDEMLATIPQEQA